MAAEEFLRGKVDVLSKLIIDKYKPNDEENIHRQIVDMVRCIQELRRLKKKIDTKLSVNITPHLVTYLEDPID